MRRECPWRLGDCHCPIECYSRALWLGDGPLSQGHFCHCPSGHGHQRKSHGTPLTIFAPQAVEAPELSHTPHFLVSHASSGETLLPTAPHAAPSRCNSPRPSVPLPSFSDQTPHACVAPPVTADSPAGHGGSFAQGSLALARRQRLLETTQ